MAGDELGTRLCQGLLLATCVAAVTSVASYRAPQIYAVASTICVLLMWLSTCVGLVVIVRELTAGRRNVFWPGLLTLVTGGLLALVFLGDLLGLPES